MSVGSGGVVDFVYTTTGIAEGVIALNGVGGLGVVDRSTPTPPLTFYLITEQDDNFISTESGDQLITQG
jgi:hypothetical protein